MFKCSLHIKHLTYKYLVGSLLSSIFLKLQMCAFDYHYRHMYQLKLTSKTIYRHPQKKKLYIDTHKNKLYIDTHKKKLYIDAHKKNYI